jgi:hypothetical protein
MQHVTRVCAVNPKNGNTYEGFERYSPTVENAVKSRKQLTADIRTGRYKKWTGKKRVAKIDRFKRNGWDIRVEPGSPTIQ